MRIEKVSLQNYRNNFYQSNNQRTSFYGNEEFSNKEKKDYSKYMIGATALAGGIAITVLGAKGHLGKKLQKFFGTAPSEKSSKSVLEMINPFCTVKEMEKWIEKSDFQLIKKDKLFYLQTKNGEPVVKEKTSLLSENIMSFKTKEKLREYLDSEETLFVFTNQKDDKGKNIIEEIAIPYYITR